MTAHPDDVKAIHELGPLKVDLVTQGGFTATLSTESAVKIIAALAAAHAKRLPAVVGVIDDLRNMRACGKILPEMCEAAADLLETQAAALAAAHAKRLPKEVSALLNQLHYLAANWAVDGYEVAAQAATQAADLLETQAAALEAATARAEKAESAL